MKYLFQIFVLFCLFLLIGCVNEEKQPYVEEPFGVVVLPDIQNYSAYDNNKILFSQINWIIQNKDSNNIKFVIFEGDLVNNWDSKSQWADVNTAVSLLEDANIPFQLNLGNHDHDFSDPNSLSTNFLHLFPSNRFSSFNWWRGDLNSASSFQQLKIGSNDFLFLGLDICPSKEKIAWANEIFSDSNALLILTTHGYLDENAKLNVNVCNDTSYIWQMAKRHKNLKIILSGHMHGEANLVSMNDFNIPVWQMLADYQDYPEGGSGFLRILTFDPQSEKVFVRTYSPYLDEFKSGSLSEFDFNYTFN